MRYAQSRMCEGRTCRTWWRLGPTSRACHSRRACLWALRVRLFGWGFGGLGLEVGAECDAGDGAVMGGGGDLGGLRSFVIDSNKREPPKDLMRHNVTARVGRA